MLFGCHVVWLFVFFAEEKRNHSAINKTTKPQNHTTTKPRILLTESVLQFSKVALSLAELLCLLQLLSILCLCDRLDFHAILQ